MKRQFSIYNKVVGLTLAALTFTACTDKWDEHFDEAPEGLKGGSLWEAISANPELSNFKSVIEATGYDKQLNSSQKFTVFIPTNASFTAADAQQWIDLYNKEKSTVSDDDNQTLKELVKNHIALYNYSVSSVSNDSIRLMNGKYGVLKSNSINDIELLTAKDNVYQNGVLYTVGEKLAYKPNVFEYIRKDTDLDSLKSFLYNDNFYYKVFLPGQSVEGGLDEQGRTVYLDSVFYQRNELFNYVDYINQEDSLFWMLAPKNAVWDQLLTEYQNYFKYPEDYEYKDSLEYVHPRLAIVCGTVFSGTFNKGVFGKAVDTSDPAIADSALSIQAVRDYSRREGYWGANFNYYEYYNAWQPGGVFAEVDTVQCSNGVMRKVSQWPIDKLQTFARFNIYEAEGGYIWELSKDINASKDTITTIEPKDRAVPRDTIEATNFHGKIWNNTFVEFVPAVSSVQHSVTFGLTNVLSNFGYDLYLVTAPAVAYDKDAPEAQRKPCRLRCTLEYKNEAGKFEEKRIADNVENSPDSVDYILLAENFKFPVSNYALNEDKPSVKLKIETRVSNSQLNKGTHTRTMRIDCVLLVPHGALVKGVVPNHPKIPASQYGKPAVLMKPHGDTPQANPFYKLR
jgi:hypothetical protein